MQGMKDELLADGRYCLKSILGEGTYGTVWLAEDTQLRKNVAVKTLHQRMGKVIHLEREARAQAVLNHPNIAIIYSVDIDDRFIAMEYIEGESLDSFLKKRITEDQWVDTRMAAGWLGQCFEAIMCAHMNSVVHGDIKPGNIMIDKSGNVKITDFGVAKVLSEEAQQGYGGETRRLGSITYIAPEALKGRPRDFKSDIFSLGVLSYLLFTKHHPFFNCHPSGLFTVKDVLLSDSEAKDPREHDRSITELQSRVILRMLQKNPEDRYSTIKEAYEEFANLGFQCGKCNSRNPVGAKFCNQCGFSLERARLSQYIGKSAEDLAALAFTLNGVEQFEEAIEASNASLRLNPRLPQAYHTRGFSLSRLGRFGEALESYDEALRQTPEEQIVDRSKKAKILANMCYCYERLGDYPKSKQALDKALEYDPDYFKAKDLLQRGWEKGYW